MEFNTPILFLIFNRPDATAQVFAKIREARPKQLFIAADGPRYPLKNEINLCQQARAITLQVDWPCEVRTLFQDKNFGVGRGGVEGINWFFQHVEAGIILEDDCIPSEIFFEFCSKGLKKFEDDRSVMMLAGTNYHFGKYEHLQGFYRSKHYAIWGWATWRRAWQLYSYDIACREKELTFRQVKRFFGNTLIAQRWAKIFDDIKCHRLEAWDAQWIYACIKNKATSVSLTSNMIANIGYFGGHAGGVITQFHEMPCQNVDVKKSLEQELSTKQSLILDIETYDRIGFLHRESRYKLVGRAILQKIPLLKRMHERVKQFKKIIKAQLRILEYNNGVQ